MPCWVVPAVAAEFWGVSVEQVLADVAAGRVATQREGGLLFVAVGPPVGADLPAFAHDDFWPRRTSGRRSLAWASPGTQPIVTVAERDALLLFDDARDVAASSAMEIATVEAAPDESLDDPPGASPDASPELPESVHDDGEPAPLPDGPEEATTPVPLVDEPPQWESVRSRVARTRRPPPRARDAA